MSATAVVMKPALTYPRGYAERVPSEISIRMHRNNPPGRQTTPSGRASLAISARQRATPRPITRADWVAATVYDPSLADACPFRSFRTIDVRDWQNNAKENWNTSRHRMILWFTIPLLTDCNEFLSPCTIKYSVSFPYLGIDKVVLIATSSSTDTLDANGTRNSDGPT
jgi:hypothetical protein